MFLFLISLAFGQTSYLPLADQTWKNCQSENFFQDDSTQLSYRACLNNISPNFLKNEIFKASQAVFLFAEMHGLRTYECPKNLQLEIYQVEMEVLNDKKRFPKYQNMSDLPAWGLYDPRISEQNVSSIVLTDHGNGWNKITIAHEISHYWFDRFCWNRLWKKSPEDFALEFEKYYSK